MLKVIFFYHWIHFCLAGCCRSRATNAEENQNRQRPSPHLLTLLLFSLFQSFAFFLRKEISRVRFIFTPRSLAPLTHSPILGLTPSLWPRPHKFWKYCYGWGSFPYIFFGGIEWFCCETSLRWNSILEIIMKDNQFVTLSMLSRGATSWQCGRRVSSFLKPEQSALPRGQNRTQANRKIWAIPNFPTFAL